MTNRNILGTAFIVFALTTSGWAAEEGAGGIAHVDIRKALESVEAGKSAKGQLEKEVAAKQAELEKSKAALQKEAEAFEKRAAILNESAKAAKQGELQKKFMELQKAAQESQLELQKRDRDLTEPIVSELKSIIEAIAKEKNYSYVLEKNESGIVYASGNDLTPTVIEKFNQRNKGKKKK